MVFVPVPLVFNFVGITNGHPAKQNRFAIGTDKPVSLHPYPGKLVCLLAAERLSVRTIMPPTMIIICLSRCLGVDFPRPGQGQAGKKRELDGSFHFVLRFNTANETRLASLGAGQNKLSRSHSRTFPGTILNRGCGVGIFIEVKSRSRVGSRFFNFRFKCRHS